MSQGLLCQQFFHHTATLWNSLPIEWFPLTYDLNGFNLQDTTDWNKYRLADFKAGKTQLITFDLANNWCNSSDNGWACS